MTAGQSAAGRDDRRAPVVMDGAPELIASIFHETYERLAPSFGYATRPESAVEWADIPANNRALMTAVVRELLERRVIGVVFPGPAGDAAARGERRTITREMAERVTARSWWLCPYDRCPHALVLHDGDGDDEPFTCCVDGCECRGAPQPFVPPWISREDSTDDWGLND